VEIKANLAIHSLQSGTEMDRFRELFTAYYPFVVRRILQVVGDQQTAEDLAQDVFLQFYHADRTAIEHIPAWLSKASLYAAYNHLRAEKRRSSREERAATEKMQVVPSSEEAWMEREELVRVRDALSELDERDRTLLLMKYSGYAYAELAKATGVEPVSVGTVLARARKKFRRIYMRMRGEAE